MIKELTPLEALEKLTNYKCSCMSEKIECKNIIETALKELEVKREVIGDILSGDDEKKLKALEIIKLKQVNILTFYKCCGWNNPSHYNDSSGCPVNFELTQEEYELLVEVLL